MQKLLTVTLSALVLAGCASNLRTVQLQQDFDVEAARRLAQPGINIVEGSALIRQQDGDVVTCAGLPVLLVPKTAYSEERMYALYGNTVKGFMSVDQTEIAFMPDHPGYSQHIKSVLCDAQGYFKFDDVADGDFYLVSKIVWQAGKHPQGGSLMQAVGVRAGQTEKVVLSP